LWATFLFCFSLPTGSFTKANGQKRDKKQYEKVDKATRGTGR